MQIEGDEVVFSTGKSMRAKCGIIGLSPAGSVIEDYDGKFYHLTDDEAPALTPGECVELADFMIEQWQEFRAKYAKGESIPMNATTDYQRGTT